MSAFGREALLDEIYRLEALFGAASGERDRYKLTLEQLRRDLDALDVAGCPFAPIGHLPERARVYLRKLVTEALGEPPGASPPSGG